MANPIQVFTIYINDDLGTGWTYSNLSDDKLTVITQSEVTGANAGQRPDLVAQEGQLYVTGTHSTQYANGNPGTIGHSLYKVAAGRLVFVYTDGWGPQ